MLDIFNKKELKKCQETLKAEQNKIALKEEQLDFKEQSLDAQKAALEKKQADLSDKEETIITKELEYNEKKQNAEKNFINEKNQVYNEKYQEHIDSLTKLYDERINKETEFHQKLESLYNDKVIESSSNFAKEHSKLIDLLQKEKEEFEKNISKLKKEFDESVAEIRENLNQKEQSLLVKENELEDMQIKLNSQEEYLKTKEAEIDNQIEKIVQNLKKDFEKERYMLNGEIQAKRAEILEYKEYKIIVDNFKEEHNENLDDLLKEIKNLQKEIKEKKEEIIDKEYKWSEKYNKLDNELEKTREEKDEIFEQARLNDYNKLLDEKTKLEIENDTLKDTNKSLEQLNNFLKQTNERLSASYQDGSARDKRIETLYQPYIKDVPASFSDDIDEIDWLKDIHDKIKNYGFEFSKRLLYSFHTSLKTAEWSPLTVLSGVSGTGKSALPKLYAHFGGFNFMPVSVQPNWDSQEAMLGFFNSIDNKFDAQPLLKFLVQTQDKDNKSGKSLNDYMNIILLDEMNLAHIELYFAEFLSKLELRRGEKENIPTLPIKLGVGMEDFQLTLGKNVLWVGTINQDETTKTLSDKVIDRGMIINFPRPKEFARRKKLQQLDKQEGLLSKNVWEKWCKFECTISDDKINGYKKKIEGINEYLSKMGRALGNRVWQSIEYYMNNYPKQDENDLENAFEDQLVLKVMPKLQGVECGGKNRSALDSISEKLPETLKEDFNNAYNNNDGYFYWNSSDYLNKNSENKNQPETDTDAENESEDNK